MSSRKQDIGFAFPAVEKMFKFSGLAPFGSIGQATKTHLLNEKVVSCLPVYCRRFKPEFLFHLGSQSVRPCPRKERK